MSADFPNRDIGGIVGEWLRAQYSGLFRELESVVANVATFSEIVQADPERISLTIVNVGPGICFLSTRADIGVGNGIRIRANGGLFHVDLSLDWTLPSKQWFATATGSTTSVYVLEVKRDIGVEEEI